MSEQNGSGYGQQRPAQPQGQTPPQPQTPPSQPQAQPQEQPSQPQRPPSEAPRYGQYQQPAGNPPFPASPPHGYHYGGQGPDYQFPDRSRTEKKKYGAATLISGMVIAGLIGGGAAVGTGALMDGGTQAAPQTNTAAQSPVIVNDQENVNVVTAAAQKASPSVVTISVAGQEASGTGSGIILDGDGHILAKTHVVALGGQSSDPNVEVRTNDGRVHSAEIVGTDPFSDLAVIQIDAAGLTPAVLAESGELNVGDTAIAIGAPLGLSGTVTDGIVSTLNRTIRVASSAVPEEQSDRPQRGTPDDQGWNFAPPDGSQNQQSSQGGAVYINVIQTDAAINHGNSGGALVNADGEVVGVNVAIASGGEAGGNIGVGFSIPIDYAGRVANEIIENGEATHGFLGVSVTAKAAESSEGRTAFSVGAEVAEVVEGSPAADAGLQPDDVVTSVSGISIGDAEALTAVVRQQAQGETVEMTYLRDGEQMSTEITLGDADLS